MEKSNINRNKRICVFLLSLIFVFSALIFFYFSTDRGFTANAHYVEGDDDIGGASNSSSGSSSSSGSGSAVDNDTSFHMLEGTALSLTSYEMKFAFYVPEGYFDEFLLGNHRLGQPYLGSRETYFRLTRFTNLSYFYNSDLDYTFSQLYSIDPSQSELSSESVLSYTRQSNGMYFVEVSFPFPDNGCYDVEYYYCADIYNYTFGHQSQVWSGNKYRWVTDPPSSSTVRSSNYFQRSVSSVAAAVLENYSSLYDEDQIRRLQHFAGVNVSTSTFPVTLSFKECSGFNSVQDSTRIYNVNSLYATCSNLVFSSVTNLFGATGISDFNCVFRNVANVCVDGAEVPHLYDQRIILQAYDYEYSFDNVNNRGSLTILYRPFLYKDFAIEVRDNDTTDGSDLTFYVYPVDVATSNGSVTLTYEYSEIQNMVLNSCQWLFELDSDNFTSAGTNAHVTINVGDDQLTVTFADTDEEYLLGVRISCLAEIVPDVECSVVIEYASLDNSLNETVSHLNVNVFYSEYVRLTFADYFYSVYGTVINSSIHPVCLGGLTYYTFSNVSCSNTGTNRYKIRVEYAFNTLLRLTNDLNDTVVFRALNNNSLTYSGSDLSYPVPTGYRISELRTTDNSAVSIINNEEYFSDTQIEIKTQIHEKRLITLIAHLTDTWHVNFEFLEPYKDTCFATKRKIQKDLKVADYNNLHDLTLANVKDILGYESMDLLKSSANESLDINFDGKSTYTVSLSYSYSTIRFSEASGHYCELRVPLTCYADWCESIGQDWSILFLNNSENKYFNYSNEVAREDLYGYFTAVVFTEQISDINTWFAQESGEGAVVLAKTKEVRGSELYKACRRLIPEFAVASLFSPAGAVASAANIAIAFFCEAADSSNATYYTYFSYLDCNSDQAFLSRSGATDAYDQDGALKNAVQKAGIGSTSDLLSSLTKILSVALGIVAIVAIVYLLIKFYPVIRPLFQSLKRRRRRRRDRKNE